MSSPELRRRNRIIPQGNGGQVRWVLLAGKKVVGSVGAMVTLRAVGVRILRRVYPV